MIGAAAAAIMLIFTNAGYNARVTPPSAVPFATMHDCETARYQIESSDFSGMNGSVNIVCVASGVQP